MAHTKKRDGSRGAAFDEQVTIGQQLLAKGELENAWKAFERAHVIGQPDAWLHVRSHFWMLRCGWKQRDAREVSGQVVRLVLAAPATWLGRYPVGNTGRARVGLFTPMEVEPDLKRFTSDD